MAKRRHRTTYIVAALVVVLGILAGGWLSGIVPSALARWHPGSDRQQFVFVSGSPAAASAPGKPVTAEEAKANLQLQYGAEYHMALINYNLNLAEADGPDAVKHYYSTAEALGTKLVPSVQELLAPSNDQVVRDTVRLVDHYSSTVRYLVTDERPLGPGQPNEARDMHYLEHRCAMMHALTNKPLMGVFEWGDNSHGQMFHFFQAVERACPGMILGVDFYPFPDSSLVVKKLYGQIDPSPVFANILEIARVLHAVAGNRTWFVVQGFSWQHQYKQVASHFGFPPDSPAPDAATILRMIQWALYGGVHDIGFYSYEFAGSRWQLWQMAIAGNNATSLPGY